MCGRFAVAPSSPDAWASVGGTLGEAIETMLEQLRPLFNVAPSMQIPIVYQDWRSGEVRATPQTALSRVSRLTATGTPSDRLHSGAGGEEAQ